ncbi:MAG: hypothetical protein IJZ68_06395 [Bacteroidaceae bacterium]|nr:hypothetical protein [Bacteroidaceae bacterium]
MKLYYVPTVQPLSELSRQEFKNYTLHTSAFEQGDKLIFEEFQPALRLASREIQGQTQGQFFHDWRPIIPAVALIMVCNENALTLECKQLDDEERVSLGMTTPNNIGVHFGKLTADSTRAVSAFFEVDVLHDQYGLSAPVQQGTINLSVISGIAEKRIAALDLLADAIYRMPAAQRTEFTKEMTEQMTRFSKTSELDSLRMMLSTEPIDIKAGLPTTELFASMVGTGAKSLKGFVQDTSLGLDFGMRLLQRADKQLSWELSADTLTKVHDMHYMYGHALSQTTRDPLGCVNALSSAMLQWSWKLDRDTDAIIENIDTLGIIADEIKREMERPADKIFTEMIYAVPASEQCEFRMYLTQCPTVKLEALMFTTDMSEIYAGVKAACEYAVQEADVSEETIEVLNDIMSRHFAAQIKESHDEFGMIVDFHLEDTELADQYNEEVLD